MADERKIPIAYVDCGAESELEIVAVELADAAYADLPPEMIPEDKKLEESAPESQTESWQKETDYPEAFDIPQGDQKVVMMIPKRGKAEETEETEEFEETEAENGRDDLAE